MQSNKHKGALSDKFEGFAAVPSAELWGNISNGLSPVPAKKGMLWLWVFAGLTAVIVLGAVVWNTNSNPSQLAQSKSVERQVVPIKQRASVLLNQNVEIGNLDSVVEDGGESYNSANVLKLEVNPNPNNSFHNENNKQKLAIDASIVNVKENGVAKSEEIMIEHDFKRNDNFKSETENAVNITVENSIVKVNKELDPVTDERNGFNTANNNFGVDLNVKKVPVQNLLPFEKSKGYFAAAEELTSSKISPFEMSVKLTSWFHLGRVKDLTTGGTTIASKSEDGTRLFNVTSFIGVEALLGYKLNSKWTIYSGLAFTPRHYRKSNDLATIPSLVAIDLFPTALQVHSIAVPLKVNYFWRKIRGFEFGLGAGIISEIPLYERYKEGAILTEAMGNTKTTSKVKGFRLGGELSYYQRYIISPRVSMVTTTGIQHYFIDRFEGTFDLPGTKFIHTMSLGLVFKL